MNKIDYYYPLSESLKNGGMGAMMGMAAKLRQHTAAAKAGDLEAESRLCNRLGQLRRACPQLPPEVLDEVKEAAKYLASVGRKIDLGNKDPRMWISKRDGTPR